MNQNLGRLEQRFGGLEQRLDKRFDGLEQRLDTLAPIVIAIHDREGDVRQRD